MIDMNQSGPRLDLEKTKPLVCKCGNHTFQQISFLRIVPALLVPGLSQNGKDPVVPIVSFACNACGDVPPEVMPPFMRKPSDDTTPPPSRIELVK